MELWFFTWPFNSSDEEKYLNEGETAYTLSIILTVYFNSRWNIKVLYNAFSIIINKKH